jgi:hypothetical protein
MTESLRTDGLLEFLNRRISVGGSCTLCTMSVKALVSKYYNHLRPLRKPAMVTSKQTSSDFDAI